MSETKENKNIHSDDKTKVPEKSDAEKIIYIEEKLCKGLKELKFPSNIKYVYNPLEYAKELHHTFYKKYFNNSFKKILFLGLNPGPYGMCQNGIPFGEVNFVKNWFKIEGKVRKPEKEHPKKTIEGLEIKRNEISGRKFWQLFEDLCKIPENFFQYSFVYNLCPLSFLGDDNNGKNITPVDIKDKNFNESLNNLCNKALIEILKEFKFEIIIAVGNYAEQRAKCALKDSGIRSVQIYKIPHPSLRNIRHRNNWEERALSILKENDLLKYFINHEFCREEINH